MIYLLKNLNCKFCSLIENILPQMLRQQMKIFF